MKKLLFLYFLIISINDYAQKLCFVRDSKIYLSNMDGSKVQDITKSLDLAINDPSISPNGKTVVFTEITKGGQRYISYINVDDGLVKRFKKIPGNNNYGPIFSPDGQYIAFDYWNGSDWNIGLLDAKDTKFSNLSITNKGIFKNYHSSVFSKDGKIVIAQDLDNLIGISLDKQVIFNYSIIKTLSNAKYYLSSASYIYYMKNKNMLLISLDTDELSFGSDEEGDPLGTIVLLNLNNMSVKRLTNNKMCTSSFCVDEENEIIYFTGFQKTDVAKTGIKFNIYKMKISGGEYKKIIENAAYPTVSKQ